MSLYKISLSLVAQNVWILFSSIYHFDFGNNPAIILEFIVTDLYVNLLELVELNRYKMPCSYLHVENKHIVFAYVLWMKMLQLLVKFSLFHFHTVIYSAQNEDFPTNCSVTEYIIMTASVFIWKRILSCDLDWWQISYY